MRAVPQLSEPCIARDKAMMLTMHCMLVVVNVKRGQPEGLADAGCREVESEQGASKQITKEHEVHGVTKLHE